MMNRLFDDGNSRDDDDDGRDDEQELQFQEGMIGSLKGLLDSCELPHTIEIHRVTRDGGNIRESRVTVRYDPASKVMGSADEKGRGNAEKN